MRRRNAASSLYHIGQLNCLFASYLGAVLIIAAQHSFARCAACWHPLMDSYSSHTSASLKLSSGSDSNPLTIMYSIGSNGTGTCPCGIIADASDGNLLI